jgi:hypothetical protein
MPADQTTHRAEVESIVGRVYIHAGTSDKGTDLVRRSYAVMCELGDQWSMGMGQTTLGFAAQLCGDIEEGERVTHLALEIPGRSIDAWLTHASHRLLGRLHRLQGDASSIRIRRRHRTFTRSPADCRLIDCCSSARWRSRRATPMRPA